MHSNIHLSSNGPEEPADVGRMTKPRVDAVRDQFVVRVLGRLDDVIEVAAGGQLEWGRDRTD